MRGRVAPRRARPGANAGAAGGTDLERQLAIGIARQQNLADIGTRQWLAHARECGLEPDRTLEIVRHTVRDAPEAIAAARETVRGRDENREQHAVDRRAEELVGYARTRRRVFEEEESRRFTKTVTRRCADTARAEANTHREALTVDEIKAAEE